MKKRYQGMKASILLNGPKDIFQVEFSRLFALRYVFHFVRCIQRLLWRSTFLRILVLFIFAIVVIAYALFSTQNQFQDASASWVIPKTCVADDCKVKQPLLMEELSSNLFLILIHSSIKSKSTRDAIRNTWVSQLTNKENSPIQYRFVLAGDDVDLERLYHVRKESAEYKDIIVLPDVTDTFHRLTLRTIGSFKYVLNHMDKFSYVMKCDDDSMVDVMRVASELQLRKAKSRFYWGYMIGGSVVVTGWMYRYYENNWFTCTEYVPYSFGGGYILSGDLIELIAQNAHLVILYNNEDVSVGAWLAPYNIEYKHDTRFTTGSYSRGCKDPFLVVHKVSISDMSNYYESYMQEDRLCSWRTYWHSFNGFMYNWNSRPSECCRKNPEVP